jgi:hypothetical protein
MLSERRVLIPKVDFKNPSIIKCVPSVKMDPPLLLLSDTEPQGVWKPVNSFPAMFETVLITWADGLSNSKGCCLYAQVYLLIGIVHNRSTIWGCQGNVIRNTLPRSAPLPLY